MMHPSLFIDAYECETRAGVWRREFINVLMPDGQVCVAILLQGSLPVQQALEEVKQRGDCAGTAAQMLQGAEGAR